MRIMAAFFGGGIVQRHIPRPFGPHGPMVFFGDMCQPPAPISHGRFVISCFANKGICLGTFSMHRFKRECQCRFLPTCSVCLI